MIADVSSLKSILSDAEVFNDGDWVESKDQDPDGDVRLIQLADIGDGEYLNKSNRFMTSSKAKALRCTYLNPGDLLLARMPDPLGRCCIFPGDEKPCVTVVDVCIVRPNTEELDTRWLMHCLNAPKTRHQIQTYTTGTTRKRISRSNLGKIGINVPPLEEQKRIGEVLDRAEALRARRRAALALLNELTQSIFLDMFGDPTLNHHGFTEHQLSGLIREKDKINYGVVQPGEHVDDGVPLVRVGDLKSGRVRHDELKRISTSIEKTYKRSRLKGDEILVSCVGSVGVVSLAQETERGFNIARAVARIPLNDSCNREFVAEYLRSDFVQRYFTGELRTVSQPTLNIKQIGETCIKFPPKEQQDEFASRIASLGNLKSIHHRAVEKLEELFSSLQSFAFKGEL